jgi:hypothetical protein
MAVLWNETIVAKNISYIQKMVIFYLKKLPSYQYISVPVVHPKQELLC